MKDIKDLGKQALYALIVVLVTMLVTGVFAKNDKIKNAATKQELNMVEERSNRYTDDVMGTHEKKEVVRDAAIDAQYNQIQSDLTLIKKYLIEKK
jgi:GTP-binding protein EngB required for normal cell division